MKLKNIFTTSAKIPAVILSISLLTGCSKWLDVNPSTRIKEEEQFSVQQGYVDALFGTYQKLAEEGAYGRLGTYGFVDVLGQLYENKTATAYYGETARYNYVSEVTTGQQQNVRGAINAIWSGYYSAIAQANLILKNVDSRNILSGTSYRIIKGEALALRAFVHFDLLRLFAPAYLNGANANAAAIPYVEQFTINPTAKLTVAEVLDKVERDLKEAEALLEAYTEIDQIAANQGSTSLDLFLMYRQNHLNYWAAKAVLARVYQYKGDKVNALKYATDVINSKKFNFVNPGTLSVDATVDASDLTFSSEHIFSLNVSNLKKFADNYFKSELSASAEASDLFSTKAKLNTLYESTLTGYGTDIRTTDASKSLWNQFSTAIVFTRKYYSDKTTNVKQRLVPIIRLPELYYIAAEAAPTIVEGLNYLNTVRQARLIPALSAATITTTALFDAEVQKEYRKEFYGEGQIWFYFKRKNVTTIPDGVGNPMTAAKYTFPLPLNEIEFGL